MSSNVKSTILKTLHAILQEQGETDRTIDIDASLNAELGLSSMNLAELVSELEMALGVDPFEAHYSITDIVTLRDLIGAYEAVIDGTAKTASDELANDINDIVSA